jgi:hypothetical protein
MENSVPTAEPVRKNQAMVARKSTPPLPNKSEPSMKFKPRPDKSASALPGGEAESCLDSFDAGE